MHPMTGTVYPAHNAHSWPRTSTGPNLDAFQAGQKPKKFPATAKPIPLRHKVPGPT